MVDVACSGVASERPKILAGKNGVEEIRLSEYSWLILGSVSARIPIGEKDVVGKPFEEGLVWVAEVARSSCDAETLNPTTFSDGNLLEMTSKFSGGMKWSRASAEVSRPGRKVRLTGAGTGIGSVGRGREAGEDVAAPYRGVDDDAGEEGIRIGRVGVISLGSTDGETDSAFHGAEVGGICIGVDGFDNDLGEGVTLGRTDWSLAGLTGGGGGTRTAVVGGDVEAGEARTFLPRGLG
jgi:hypothetical protein